MNLLGYIRDISVYAGSRKYAIFNMFFVRVQAPLSLLPLRVRKVLILLAFRLPFAYVFLVYNWIQIVLAV